MENFVLNLFSDQLSKIILDFHQSTINANFLSGKGSITNVKLNVDLINDFLNKPPHGSVPFLEFTEITLTELRVEVTSYTNLKKAPIVLVIEEIHAKAREPLEYHVDPDKKKNDEANHPPPATAKKNASQPQQYGLLHRILDNLSIKIKRIHLSFSSLGKFKTRRHGIWTPPTLQICLDNVEWISVTETGNPGTPDMVWSHNELSAQQSRFRRDSNNKQQQNRHRSYVIYKRLSMICQVKLLPSEEKQSKKADSEDRSISTLISDTKVDVHLAYIRRLRDAGVTGADMDVQVYDVNINLDVASYRGSNNKKSSASSMSCDLGAFVHMLVGILHCYYKDRSFLDPLLPEGVLASSNNNDNVNSAGLLRGFSSAEKKEASDIGNDNEEEEAGPDDFLPEVALMDDDLESSDESDYEEEPDEEHDEAFLAWKRGQDQKEGGAQTNESVPVEQGELSAVQENDLKVVPSGSSEQSGGSIKMSTSKEGGNDQAPTKSYKRKRKAVIVVASGAQKFEKLSFSLSIPRINMKLCLPPEEDESRSEQDPTGKEVADSDPNHHCLELLLEGLVAECIWPKDESGEMGGHVQGSIKYCHILESAYQTEWGTKTTGTFGPKPWNVVKISPLVRIGRRMFQGNDAFQLSSQLKSSHDNVNSFSKCDEFPLMENRQTTWKWDRHLNGPRALAFKSTISFVDETLTRWSQTNVQHEASLGEFEVVLDSSPLERLTKLFSDPRNQDSLWFDDRWLSGEWHTEIAADMMAVGNSIFSLKDHLQPLPSLYPSSKQSPLSSSLRSITLHSDSVTVRLPNPLQDISSFRLAEVIFSIAEATMLVTNDLPSSFLSGVVTTDNTSHDFPHDPSDISSVAAVETSTDLSTEEVTKFRMQISITDCSLKIMPVQAYSLNQDERCFGNLIAPTNVTMIMSLEHENKSPNEANPSIAHTSRTLILSVLLQSLESNVEMRSIYGALETFKYHAEKVMKHCSAGNGDESIPAESNVGNTSSIICIHVPDVEINIWGEQSSNILGVNEMKTSEAQQKHSLLCQIKSTQFEFGMEFATLVSEIEKITRGAVYKCAIASVLVEICSRVGDDNRAMVEILTMGSEASSRLHLVEKACTFCSPNKATKGLERGFFLRSEKIGFSNSSSTANAVEISSPLAVDLNTNAIEFFLNRVVECLASPVFVGSRNRFQIGQTSLGSAFWSIILKICALFTSPRSELIETEDSVAAGNSLFRMSVDQLLLLVPGESEGQDSFGLPFCDVEIAVGESQWNEINALNTDSEDTTKYCHIVKKNCGHGYRTWLKEFHLDEGLAQTTAPGTFYALRSKHSMLRVGCSDQASGNTRDFKAIIPASCINWSLPVGLGGSSAPPFDLFAVTDLGLLLMNMGMPLSSLYFKLYKLSPRNESAQSDFSLAATRLHNLIGSYHCKMHNLIGQLNAEADRLRKAVFAKEFERVGALAMASSTASGWVRVGEDLSFSHRIFSSATFWRYWMVLDKSLLILYESPGTRPSFIIPLRASSQLRSLSMSSSSNKTGSGIVRNHVQQKGFAVFDSAEGGTGLFFVANSDSDYNMWVQAISMTLKKEDTPTLDDISSTKIDSTARQGGDALLSMTNQVGPPASSFNVDPLGVFDGGTPTAPPQAPNLSPFGEELTPNYQNPPANGDPFGAIDVPVPTTTTHEEISPTPIASMDSFGHMEDVGIEDLGVDDVGMEDGGMEEISLGDSEIRPNEFSAFIDASPSMESPAAHPAPTASPAPLQEPQNTNSIAGKSKIATSKFLKSAKGGMLAASERLAKEAPRKEEPMKRSLAMGQKMSMLKRNANSKLAAARSSMHDQNSVRTEEPSSSSRDELSNRKYVVGQKIGHLKKNASTKLTSLGTSVRSSIQDQPLKSVNTEDSSGPPEVAVSLIRRLKIDEKVTQFSAAVKSGVKNDAMIKQISNVSRSHSRNSVQRIGIGEETKSIKPIKFDARETFSASSDIPLKVKSITLGEAMLVDDHLFEKVESLQRIEGNSWVVTVDAIKTIDALSIDRTNHYSLAGENMPQIDPQAKPSVDNHLHYKWTYKITVTDVSEASAQSSAERTISEVLTFHTNISEMFAKGLPSTAKIASQEGITHAGTISPVFEKLSPIDRLRVSGTLLQRVLEVKNSSSMRDNHCELIKVFVSTLLECHMPKEAVTATKVFLKIESSDDCGTYLTNNGTRFVDEAFDLVYTNAMTLGKQPVSPQATSVEFDPKSDQVYSSLLNVIMNGYAKATKERDEALASLATTSIINDNRVMQEQLRKSNGDSKPQAKVNSSDEDMVNLCKQLGNEIASRTKAEAEINRLNERLEFEQKIAQAKEKELRAKLESYEKNSHSAIR